MVRTRDFFLVLLALGFGVIVTGAQLFSVWFAVGPQDGVLTPTETPTSTYTAVISDTKPDYASRIALLRQKLALRKDEAIAMPEPEPSEQPQTIETATTTETVTVPEVSVKICANYQTLAVIWNPKSIVIEDAAFSRNVVSRETVGTTTVSVVRVTLPKLATLVSAKNCIPADIVGIALDGSLIRNDEYKVYGVFGEGTLIGYALDGAAIYGQTSSLATDACGGTVIDGVYRYYLSDERDGILGCYSGTPQMVK